MLHVEAGRRSFGPRSVTPGKCSVPTACRRSQVRRRERRRCRREGVNILCARRADRWCVQRSRFPFSLLSHGLAVVDLMIANLSVPSDRTTSYFMVPFSLPNADSIHIVGFEGLIKSRLLHHFILFSCASGTTLSPNIQGPSAFEMKSDCVDVLFGWLPGLPPVVTPRTAGFRSGRTLLLQAHYNNPSREKGVVDTSGVRIHFTTRPRAFNMGMLWTGGVVSLFVPDHVMPAGRAAFFDTRACFVSTASAVTVVASTAHAHKTGRRVWSELFRLSGDNATVERIAELGRNDAYDFESQQAVPLNNIQLRDGDLISTTCVYDSTARNSGTVGGHGTDDEMCLNWLTVYPSFNTECVSIRQVGPLASGTLFSGASQPLVDS